MCLFLLTFYCFFNCPLQNRDEWWNDSDKINWEMCEIGEACLGDKIRNREICTSKEKPKRNNCLYIVPSSTGESSAFKCAVTIIAYFTTISWNSRLRNEKNHEILGPCRYLILYPEYGTYKGNVITSIIIIVKREKIWRNLSLSKWRHSPHAISWSEM